MRNLLVLLSIPLLASPASAEQRLSLAEARERVAASPRLQAASAAAEEAFAAADQAEGMLYPALNASLGYTRTNDPVAVFGAKLQQQEFAQADFALPALNDPASLNHWRTRLELVQPLLHSTTDWKNREAARSGARASKLRQEFEVRRGRLHVTSLYYQAAALEERGRILEEGAGWLKRLEESYQLKSAPTAATTTSYLLAQSVRLGLAARKSGVETARSNVLRGLQAFLGIPQGEPVVLTDPLPEVADGTVAATASEREDVRAAAEEASAARAALAGAKGEWGPRLDFVGGYNLYTGDFESSGDSYDLNAFLTWPIFTGPRSGRIGAASKRLAAAEQIRRASELEAAAALESARADLGARLEEYKLIESAAKKATDAIQLSKRRYAEGTLPLFHYSDSIQTWVATREELVESRRRAAEARSRFDFERGAL